MNVVIYARFSPRPRAAECESVESQIEECRAFAEKNGWEIRGEFSDKDISGGCSERPGLDAAIDALKKGDLFLARDWERIARGFLLANEIRERILKKGARTRVINGINGETLEELLAWQINRVYGEYQRLKTAQLTSNAMKRRVKNGAKASSEPPYGWRLEGARPEYRDGKIVMVGGRLVEVENEQRAVARIMELRASDESYRTICEILDSEGYVPRGARWYPETIRRIMQEHRSKGNKGGKNDE